MSDPMKAQDPMEAEPRIAGGKTTALVTCKATARSGLPCKNPVVPGATVCRFHGGAAPQVRRKAALRLLELVDPAITTLAREMVQADKSSDRQRAANSILDRAGVPRTTVEVNGDAARAMLIERLRAMREQQEQAAIDSATAAANEDESDAEPTVLIQSEPASTDPQHVTTARPDTQENE